RDPRRAAGLAEAGIELATGDLRDAASVREALRDVSVAYNIAALYREAGLPDDTYFEVNARAVASLIASAAHAGVRRVVHCSTVGVHGDVGQVAANEDAPFAPGDVYQQSKVEGERRAREAERLASEAGPRVEVVIARPTGIYGPRDSRLLKLFRGVARRRFVYLGAGRILYHLTYVEDVAEGLRLCGEVQEAAGRTYIIGGPETPTLTEIVAEIAAQVNVPVPTRHLPVWPVWIAGAVCEAICRPFGLEPPLYRRRVDFFTKSRAFDISRARRELGYAPAVGLKDGIRRSVMWYREHGWL
ncbi:MAG TPA: NAD-dependent epimerase/dehydratase family protein, partial [Vicinamibacterales bacterium]